jgi:uncharacterized protein YqeY
MLIEKIKNDQLAARKRKDEVATALLTTLLGEAAAVGKNAGNRDTTDEEVVAIVKKFLKNNEELIQSLDSRCLTKDEETFTRPILVANRERELLVAYLPVQLTEEQLRDIIKEIISARQISPKVMGEVMSELKKSYAGRYDGGLASRLTKELL